MTSHTLRIIDASLNRASEGLRVVEDYARFVLDDGFLSKTAKELRHELAQLAADSIPSTDRHTARDTPGDVGTAISTISEAVRGDIWEVCVASLKRVEQALRSLEEYGKLVDPKFSAGCEGLRYRTYTLEKALHLTRTNVELLAECRVCVLIDGQESQAAFQKLVEQLVTRHPIMLQLRDKQLEDRTLQQRARLLVAETRGTDTLAIINDRVDIAASTDADGVHLGQEDLPVNAARGLLKPGRLVGVSTHSIEQARQAVLDGADYLGAGPTFPSRTKSFDRLSGLDYLRELSQEITLPAFAIGGVDAENLVEVVKAGMYRVAVASCISSSDNPVSSVLSLHLSLGGKPLSYD